MGCPTQCVLGKNLTFTVQCRDSTGAAVDATGSVSYSIYEDETGTAIATGTMSKLDDAGTTGFYSEQIACSTTNGYEQYKSYTIRITATVSGVVLNKTYTFLCLSVYDSIVTATTGALTTTDNFKNYCGISVATYDTLIGYLIARATGEIQKYCQRDLLSTTYRERYNGDGSNEIILKQYPVTAVSLFADSITDAFAIRNTTSDAYRATVKINETQIVLTVYGGSRAGADTLTLADYTTITDLNTAISALSDNWDVTLNSTFSIWPPTELLPQTEKDCLNSYTYPQVPEDTVDNYEVDYNAGIVYAEAGIGRARQNVVIKYTAGYATTPADLEQICIDLVKYYYNKRSRTSGASSETIGDYSYSLSSGSGEVSSEISDIRNRLDPFARRSISSIL